MAIKQTRQQHLHSEVAQRLKAAREAAGYATEEEFCDKNNLALETYLKHEAGEIPIKLSYGLKYAKLLGISFSSLMLGENIK